jgi:hypothetical protein
MVQKPIAISVISAVTLVGILMLAILATISSTNQTIAQAKPTILSLGSSPTSGHVGAHTGTLPVSLFGKLTSDHSPVEGASVIITGTGEDKQFSVITNQFGSYGSQVSLGPGTHIIKAHFAGDSDHTSSSATRIVTVK